MELKPGRLEGIGNAMLVLIVPSGIETSSLPEYPHPVPVLIVPSGIETHPVTDIIRVPAKY